LASEEAREDTPTRRRATVGPASLRTAESLVDLAAALDPTAEKERRRGLLEEARAVYAMSLPVAHPRLAEVDRELASVVR
jgi:hypothetical protein